MVSLKKYTREQVLTEGNNRFKKIASLLDKEDLEDMLEQSLSWLDEAIFTPREMIIQRDDIIGYKGGFFVDVSNQKIDVINNVYYEDTFGEQVNVLFPELGILPFISNSGGITTLSTVADYISLKGNLNMINRQLEMDGDYELWPRDENGLQLLQVRTQGMMRVEFLPSIDRDATEWYLYDYEYAALKDVLFDKCNLFNAEMQMSATALGVGKESEALANYWKTKLQEDMDNFSAKALVTYIA
jgi:hypothetical protein